MKELNEPSTNTGAQTDTGRTFPWLLAIGDWLVLLLFVIVGQTDHNILGMTAVPSLLITTLSLALPWTIVSFLLGGYRPQSTAGLWSWIGRCLTIWLVAAPLGLMLRAFLRGQTAIVLVFMVVLLGVGGLFVLGWRAVYWWWYSRQTTAASHG